LDEQEDRLELPPSQWPESLLGPLGSGELGELTRELIVSRQLDRLLACAARTVVIEAAGLEPSRLTPDATSAPRWSARYPTELRPAIRRLATLQEDAEARVARWLADDFPDPARLRQEIEALETRLRGVDETSGRELRTRLRNLRERLGRPPSPGAARLQ